MFSAFFTRLRDALLKQYIRTSQVVPERSVFSACKCSDKILAATPWRVLAVRTPGIQRLWSWSTFRELLRQNDINDEPGWRIKRLKFHSNFWFLEGLAESSVSMLRSDPQTCVVFWKKTFDHPATFIQHFGNNSSIHLHLHPFIIKHRLSIHESSILKISIPISISILSSTSAYILQISGFPTFFLNENPTQPTESFPPTTHPAFIKASLQDRRQGL